MRAPFYRPSKVLLKQVCSGLPKYRPDIEKFLEYRTLAFGSRDDRVKHNGKTDLERMDRWDSPDRRTSFGVATQKSPSTCNPQKSNYMDGDPDEYLEIKAGMFYVSLALFLLQLSFTF